MKRIDFRILAWIVLPLLLLANPASAHFPPLAAAKGIVGL